MKLALVGTGQTGSAVARRAEAEGHELLAVFDSERPLPRSPQRPGLMEEAEVVVDFSLPDLALDHIERYCRWQVPAVIGTTGWYDGLSQVREWVDEHDASLLYAPNFSLGVALMVRALRGTLPLLNELAEYDAYVHEVHHTKKLDSPSGTARMLGETIIEHLDRKTAIEPETQHGRIQPDKLHVSSTRAGRVFGTHVVGLDSASDQVRIEHDAKNRMGFAAGALTAARWLVGRRGLFTLDDVLQDLEAAGTHLR